MINYEDFEVKDFICDEFFMEWILTPKIEHHQFWDNWLLQHPDRRPIVERAKKVLLSLRLQSATSDLTENEISAIAQYVKDNVDAEVRRSPMVKVMSSRWLRVAAILVVAVTLGIIFKNKSQQQRFAAAPVHGDTLQYTNNTPQAKFIKLNDGSLVILKPNSWLRFPKHFNSANREVNMEGEAFFEVHKNPEQPFLVYSHNMIAKVLGTSFTVRAFYGEGQFKVIVNTGKVQVFEQNQQHVTISAIVLTPNQQATLTRKIPRLLKDTVAIPLMLSQKVATRLFSFDNAPLAVIITKLEEAYHVQINYDKTKFAHATVTASLSQLPLDEKIKMVCKAIDAQCNFDNGTITIK